MPGGNVGHGIIVDLSALDRPCRVSLASSANVGAAVTWRTLDEVAGHFGYRLPPDPSSGAFCTVGGMVATNAAGALSGVRDEMEALVRQQAERILGQMDLVQREEFDVVQDMARKAREENDALKKQLEALEQKIAALEAGK